MNTSDNVEKARAIVSVLKQSGLVATCPHCQAVTKRGNYALLYELGEHKFLLGEKKPEMCCCGEETDFPLLFDAESEASQMQAVAQADADQAKGIPGFPFIEFRHFPAMIVH